jgi:hypothetical protein
MIGQRRNLRMIDKWIDDGCPHFICISGQRGGGKRLLSKYIADRLGISYSEVGIKVDEVREVIDSATKYGGFYVFADADTMSTNAKNALLKVTEEPPKDSYFVLTVEDEASLLDTIKSRAQMIRLEPYSKEELQEYRRCVWADFASTPHDIDVLEQYGEEFLCYVNLVIDNIREVEPANAFKSSGKLALKNEENKYDLGLFFNAIIKICRARLLVGYDSYLSQLMLITCKYSTKERQLGVNKQQLYDNWVFEVRSIE